MNISTKSICFEALGINVSIYLRPKSGIWRHLGTICNKSCHHAFLYWEKTPDILVGFLRLTAKRHKHLPECPYWKPVHLPECPAWFYLWLLKLTLKDLLRVLVCPLNLIVIFWTGVAGAKSTHNLIFIIKDDSKKKFWKKICFSASKLIKAYMSFFAHICHLTIFAYILALIIHFEAYFRFNWFNMNNYVCVLPRHTCDNLADEINK